MVKLQRANGGYLGTQRRRRTWWPTKCLGELETSNEPRVSEMGKPNWTDCWIYRQLRANPANWNILVAGGRESKSDFLSSGERSGNSLNHKLRFMGYWDSHQGKRKLDEAVESCTRGGESPVVENGNNQTESRVARSPWNSVWISLDHEVRLNTNVWPIEKSTARERWKEPRRGEWNRTWNR